MSEATSIHRLARLLGSWDEGPGNRAERLATRLQSLIRAGRLPAGARLPSERLFANALGVARTTVSHAFNILREEGTFSSRSGVGTFVSSVGSSALARGDARLQSFLEVLAADRIDMRSAALSSAPIVGEEMARSLEADCAHLMHSHGYIVEGMPKLREAIADYYAADGLPTAPEQILVTTGAQQAVQIIAKSSIEIGDTVLIEEPSYRGGIESFRAAGARLVPVPSGVDGIDIEALESALRRYRPKMVVIMSTVHNPVGSCLSMQKRQRIGELVEEHGVVLVDEAATSDALVAVPRPRPMAAYAPDALIVGSASKSFWGGLRIGWIRGSTAMLANLIAVKGAEDLGTSIPSQIVTARLLSRIEDAREYRRQTLAEARDAILADVVAHLPDWQVYRPEGGASLWVRLPAGHSAMTFTEHARRAGVDICAGPTFSSVNDLNDHLRVAFAAPRALVAEGVRRLADVWRAFA